MLTFLFWNLQKKPLAASVTTIATEHKVDVIILAECNDETKGKIGELLTTHHTAPGILCGKIHIFIRFPVEQLEVVSEAERWTIRRLHRPGQADILVAAAHLISKVNYVDYMQFGESQQFASDIAGAEVQMGHQRTIVVGDLNMDTFEPGLIGAHGLNAVMTRQIANKRTRKFQGRTYPLFYNPMWGMWGDATGGAPGTHYYAGSDMVWHLYDQVLIRSDLLGEFRNSDLKILDGDGKNSFLSKQLNAPTKKNYSDHLPLLFRLHPEPR